MRLWFLEEPLHHDEVMVPRGTSPPRCGYGSSRNLSTTMRLWFLEEPLHHDAVMVPRGTSPPRCGYGS
ncbi:hypothetical protein KUCAC02_036198 [Chaenocephalus aceratus]|nr:hypothetical protein KUCAC02_037152 [Chaenocephalus aceratus]KAI4787882.1 hypothetical protein KUCAC02_036198 [Chaenocephalus aceratus]